MAILFMVLIPYSCISAARVASSIHNYSAPLTLYNHLYSKELGMDATKDAKICVGKEWYRFGSSFFIPSKNQHLVFIKSGFDGLLPQVEVLSSDHFVAICRRKWNLDNSRAYEQSK